MARHFHCRLLTAKMESLSSLKPLNLLPLPLLLLSLICDNFCCRRFSIPPPSA
jgi:hypothetical protein